MGNRRALDAAGLAAVRARIDAGESLSHVAAAMSVSYKTVQLAARELGIRPRNRSRPQYTDVLREEAARRYAGGESAGEVSRALGTSEPWVIEQVKRAGVAIRPTGKLTGKGSEIARRYLAEESTAEIAEDLDVSDVAISRQLALAGVRVHRPGWKVRKHPLRDDSFCFADALSDSLLPSWDAEAAYWAGFIMADGTVSDTGRITLALSAVDADQIRAWLTFLGCPDVKVRIESISWNGQKKSKARAQVSSQKMAADLARNGIVPRKTHAGLPVSAALAAQPAFWRGMVDGDGTITLPVGKHGPSLSLVGSPVVMEQYADFLREVVGGTRPRILNAAGSTVIRLVKVEGVRAREAIRVLWADRFFGHCPAASDTDGSVTGAPALERKLERVRVALTWQTRKEASNP